MCMPFIHVLAPNEALVLNMKNLLTTSYCCHQELIRWRAKGRSPVKAGFFRDKTALGAEHQLLLLC